MSNSNAWFGLGARHAAFIHVFCKVQAVDAVVDVVGVRANVHYHQDLGVHAHVLLQKIRQLGVAERYVLLSL